MVKKTTNIRSNSKGVTFQKKPKGFLQFLRDRNPHLFAHHPDHPAFQEHVWIFHGLYLCKGCTVTFAGMIFGGLLYLLTGWLKWFSEVQIGFIFLALLLPTPVATLLPFPRIAKHVARFLLGILMTSALVMLFITNSWAVKAAIVFTYLVIKIPLGRKRRRDNETLLAQYTHSPRRKSAPLKN
ncbi:MAG: hypothetical protein ABSE95_02115 [Thermodesulfobacteriota bacterium]|jgi:uncharacterized membrane protein